MVGKLLGGGLVLLGTALWCRGEIQARRRETDRAAELAAALGEMAAEIRSLRRPMPRLLERQARRSLCGGCFARVLSGLERGQPLQDAWEDGFRELTPPDSMLDFFRSDTPLTDRILSDQRSGLTDCALAGVECVLEAYTYPRGEIYDLKLLLPELAMRLAEDEDTPALERAHALCASLGGEHFFTQLAPLTPRYDARDIFLATLTLYLREQTA